MTAVARDLTVLVKAAISWASAAISMTTRQGSKAVLPRRTPSQSTNASKNATGPSSSEQGRTGALRLYFPSRQVLSLESALPSSISSGVGDRGESCTVYCWSTPPGKTSNGVQPLPAVCMEGFDVC